MKLEISMADDEFLEIENFDGSNVLDLKEALDDPDEQFMQFEIDDDIVFINKHRIDVITIKD